MKQVSVVVSAMLLTFCSLLGEAQQTVATNTNVAVPPLVSFSGTLNGTNGRPVTSTVAVTFSLYSEQSGGAALWMESQNVQPDGSGHYTVMLGSTSSSGLPADIFVAGQAHWLGVHAQGQEEQPRVLLVSAPYALKAGDAQTLGGLPASAFVLAASATGSSSSAPATATDQAASPADAPPAGSVTGAGTVDYIPLWTTTSNIGNSVLFQSGTGATAKIGINTTAPTATLNVKGTTTLAGTTTVQGTLALPATGVATASAGKDSEPITHVASAYNSSSSAAVNQTFEWQAEPANNDSSTASGTLNLLFGQGTTKPAETGLHIASDGQITFAAGQTFPGTGTGDGTITGVTTASGSGLTGGGTSGTLTLGLATCSANQVLQYVNGAWTCSNAGTGTITGVTAGTDLTGGGTGGSVTLNLNTTALNSSYAQLGVANTFAPQQVIQGNGANAIIGDPGCGSGFSGFTLSNPTLSGCNNYTMIGKSSTGEVFLNSTSQGPIHFRNRNSGGNSNGDLVTIDVDGDLTAAGVVSGSSFQIGSTLFAFGSYANENAFFGFSGNTTTTGVANTASGWLALLTNTTGSYNTATGATALYLNTTGIENVATGDGALSANTMGSFNTAEGSSALSVNTTGSFNVATGVNTLFLSTTGSYNVVTGASALYSNTTGSFNTGIGSSAGYTADGSNLTGQNNTALGSDAAFSTGTLSNATAIGAYAEVGESNALVLGSINGFNGQTVTVKVGIGTTTPDSNLTVNGTADKPGGGSWGTYSDRRLKNLDGSFGSGLDQILKINPVRYRYKEQNAMGIRDRDEHVGVVAQEIQKVIPEAVTENSKGYLLVNNDPILWTMLNAIKEQQRQFEQQQAVLRNLASELRATRRSLQKVKAQLSASQPTVVAAK
jgi:hypothetical protein